ncbi:MAG: AAA family ATPase [Trueperaceae bacterium]|nr:AAA family ATPase [Trueperaceae bacterium]
MTPTSKFLKASELETMVFQDMSYVVNQLIPVGLSQLVAKPKMGKSFFSLELALTVATENNFLNLETEHGSVLYFALEDNLRRLQTRTAQIMNGQKFPEQLSFATEAPQIGSALLSTIDDWRTSVDKPKLVIIDTLGRVMPGDSRSNEYSEVTQLLGSVQQYAFDHNLAILFVHHAKKNEAEGGDHFDSSLGSQGIFGVMDAMLVLHKARMSSDAKLHVTGRDFEETILYITFDKSRGLWLPDKPNLAQELDLTPERLAVLKAIADGKTQARDIASHIGSSPSNTANKLKALLVDGYINKVKAGEYELKEDISKHFLPSPVLDISLDMPTPAPEPRLEVSLSQNLSLDQTSSVIHNTSAIKDASSQEITSTRTWQLSPGATDFTPGLSRRSYKFGEYDEEYDFDIYDLLSEEQVNELNEYDDLDSKWMREEELEPDNIEKLEPDNIKVNPLYPDIEF